MKVNNIFSYLIKGKKRSIKYSLKRFAEEELLPGKSS